MASFFASAHRADLPLVLEEKSLVEAIPNLNTILEAIPTVVAVLNIHRQVVFANQALIKLLGAQDLSPIIGRRPGEWLHCVHAHEMPGGCGTAEACRLCGAVQAVTACIATKEVQEYEARISVESSDGPAALDLRVKASPLVVKDVFLVILSITDISDEKRRQMMEKVFLHDMLNSVGSLQGLISLLTEQKNEKNNESEYQTLLDHLGMLSNTLVDEITAQRQLSAAEANELTPSLTEVPLPRFLMDIVQRLGFHPLGQNRLISIDQEGWPPVLRADPVLLARVMVNLCKNALESSSRRSVVHIRPSDTTKPSMVGISVFNEGVMDKDVQDQIFQRSFSTKGMGRGLGTYSIKLFTERYLGGSVVFQSNPEVQTVFTVYLPIHGA